jgi:hypothetical protein
MEGKIIRSIYAPGLSPILDNAWHLSRAGSKINLKKALVGVTLLDMVFILDILQVILYNSFRHSQTPITFTDNVFTSG